MKDCVSLEVAEKLQKAGYKNECQYAWCEYSYYGEDKHLTSDWVLKSGREAKAWPGIIFPAPTATQLADELPFNMSGDLGEICYLTIDKSRDVWHVGYENIKGERFKWSGAVSETLPDTLGLMMCYLLENKLIK